MLIALLGLRDIRLQYLNRFLMFYASQAKKYTMHLKIFIVDQAYRKQCLSILSFKNEQNSKSFLPSLLDDNTTLRESLFYKENL